MARAYAEMLTPRAFDLTTFPNDEGYDELVLVQDIPVRSLCEHHMLPFVGVAHVGYLPGERILGLSKLARVVDLFARRPADPGAADQAGRRPPRTTTSHPRGVGVVIEAEHTCMSLRGVRAAGARTRHLGAARHAARRPAVAGRVPRPHRGTADGGVAR